LIIRVAKTSPDLSRKDAIQRAREIALDNGHSEDSLRRSTIRLEQRDGAASREYVVEFRDRP
jgi:hypothetical protein